MNFLVLISKVFFLTHIYHLLYNINHHYNQFNCYLHHIVNRKVQLVFYLLYAEVYFHQKKSSKDNFLIKLAILICKFLIGYYYHLPFFNISNLHHSISSKNLPCFWEKVFAEHIHWQRLDTFLLLYKVFINEWIKN